MQNINFLMKGFCVGFLTLLFLVFMGVGWVGPKAAEAAVVYNATSESHTAAVGSTNQASFTWSHAGSASARGVVVFVYTISATNTVTSVTYGGTPMTMVTGGAAIDTAGEAGRVDTFFLGSSVPTGTQNVVVNRTNNTTIMYAIAMTVTAAYNTETTGIVLLQESGTYAVQSVNDGSPGSNSLRFAGGYTGATAVLGVGTGSTLGASIAFGSYGASSAYETVAGQGPRNIGFNYTTSDDRAAVHLAVREIIPDTTPPAVSSIVRVNASPTNATSVQYAVTFSESVTGVDASDFTLTILGVTGASVTGVSGSGSAYTVTVGTGSGDGTIRLDLTDNDTIVDLAGNMLGGTGVGNGNYTTGQVYTIDKTAPTVSSVAAQTGLTVDVIFSEAMGTGVTTAANYAVSGTGRGTLAISPNSVALVSGNTYRLTWSSGEMVNGGDITITVANALDVAGNSVGTPNSGTHTAGAIGVVPTLTSVHIASNNADTTKAVTGDIVTVTFTSSESITTPTVTIAGGAAAVTGGPTNWSATRTVLAGDANGVVTFSISVFSDLAGNAGSTVSTVTDASSVTNVTAPATATLTITTAGAGSGTVYSSPGTIACASGNLANCSDSTFAVPTDVTLTAAPNWKSEVVWSVGCIGTGLSCGPFTLNGNTDVTATFSHKPLVMLPGPTHYASIQDAYNVAAADAVLKARDQAFPENLVFNGVNVTFDGGYEATWTTATGFTAIAGDVTIIAGGVTVSNMVIQ